MTAAESRIAVVVNPHAGAVRRRRVDARDVAGGALLLVPDGREALHDAVRRIVGTGTRVVALLGGDGTLHRVLTDLVATSGEDALPDLVMLPGGTMNGVSKTLGMPDSPSRVLEAVRRDRVVVRELYCLRIDTRLPDGTTRRDYGFTYANGLLFRIFADYASRSAPNLLDALRVTTLPVRSLVGDRTFFSPAHIEVHTDDAPLVAGPAQVVLASTLENPTLFFHPFGRPLEGRPAFHVIANDMRPGEITLRLLPILLGRLRAHPRHRLGDLHSLETIASEGYLIDGDVYPTEGRFESHITIGPRLRFLVPEEPSRLGRAPWRHGR